MPAQPLTLHLPQPCAQSWDAMTPTAAGRHCAACQHEVVDFTTFTDGELAAYLARPGKLPCGRFRALQLGRPLLPTARPVAGWRRWWGAVAAVLGLGALAAPARAQTAPARLNPARQTAPAEAAPLLGRMLPPRQLRPKQPVKSIKPKPASARTTSVEPAELMGDVQVLTGAPMPVPASKNKPKR